MSDTQERQSHAGSDSYAAQKRHEPTAWVGFIYFAGTMAMMLGGFQVIEGLVAIFRDEYYVVTRNGLLVTMDYTAWGWTHLIIGLIAIATGIGLFMGQMWARVLGIVIAAVSALANMAFLPAYPVWCAIVIAMDVLVIYALTVHGREPAYT
ncbi:DUF7144 family membrane protein [Actinoplanes sp. NPDC049316]|uniref:DUF7144 family membrane protein n=1 Tax=Actinoplanes sp. NPDC049316 TaxID=3154727 RepID=UPI00341EB8CE